jgi:serine/threonine protein kinase
VRTEDEEIMKEIRGEYDILKKLNHPNLIRGIEIFDSEANMSIVMEKANG